MLLNCAMNAKRKEASCQFECSFVSGGNSGSLIDNLLRMGNGNSNADVDVG